MMILVRRIRGEDLASVRRRVCAWARFA